MLLRQLSALQRAESNFVANIFLNTKTWLKWTLHSIELNFLCACVPRDFSTFTARCNCDLWRDKGFGDSFKQLILCGFSFILFGFSSSHRSLYCWLSMNQILRIIPFYGQICWAQHRQGALKRQNVWYKVNWKESVVDMCLVWHFFD